MFLRLCSVTRLLGVAVLLTLAARKRHRNKDAAGCLCDSVTLIQDLEETFDIVPLCCQNTSFKLLRLFFLSTSPHLNDSFIFFKCFSSFGLIL